MGDNGEPCWRASYRLNYCAAFAIDPDGGPVEARCGRKA
jgi:hypothetical protein